jgi:hypothetical protein
MCVVHHCSLRGGKTKWYCMNMLIINIVLFKVVALFVSWKAVIADKGQRCMRRKEIEERRYLNRTLVYGW